MGVLRSRRGIAYSEFERNMAKIHRDLEQRMHALPSRYKKHICDRLYEPMNQCYNALIIADEQKGSAQGAKEKRQKYFRTALQWLMRMEKPLMAFCNIRDVSEEGREDLEKRLNYEIALIWGAAGWAKEESRTHRENGPSPIPRTAHEMEGKPVFHILRKDKMKRLAFLGKMAELHRYTFKKTAHAPNDAFDALSARIDEFCTNALYDVAMANLREPRTREEAQTRDAWLKDALDNLNAMQRPMVGLWNIMDYSEKIMDEWAGMIDEEIRILTGLREADRKRYSGLK